MDSSTVVPVIIGCVFIVLGPLVFYLLHALRRDDGDPKYSFFLTEPALEHLRRRARYGVHWVVGPGFVVAGTFAIWMALTN